VADAWAAASDEEGPEPESIGLLFVSGDEAANDPSVRSLAERADAVIAVSMFQGLVAGWADVIIPSASTLERDGTYVNLEGRLQRLRRAAAPPGPDKLSLVSQLAARFGVELAPHASGVFAEVSDCCFGGLGFGEIGEQAPLGGYEGAPAHVEPPALPEPREAPDGGLHLVCYRPLFSGPAVERVEELQFQRPGAEVALARADARARGISTGDVVAVSQDGDTVELRARLSSDVREGVALVARDHSQGLHTGPVSLALSAPKAVKAHE
ncbi:MAG TPA: molybdopterin-dependent oxidoreductase, partial [Gaiellaceae bacterium]|nr:molybdopterin-dependent oxidoreductase [Gaiellaceae bacterium]